MEIQNDNKSIWDEYGEWRYCITANIIGEHYDDEGVLWRGTKEYPSGRKVYISNSFWLDEGTVVVGGRNRFKSKYEFICVPLKLLENIRLSRTFEPTVIDIMGNFEFYNMWWLNTPKDKRDIREYYKLIKTYQYYTVMSPEQREKRWPSDQWIEWNEERYTYDEAFELWRDMYYDMHNIRYRTEDGYNHEKKLTDEDIELLKKYAKITKWFNDFFGENE